MLLTLEALKAAEGDSLLLHWGTAGAQPKLSVIDGGPARTYEDYLLPRLLQISTNRGLSQLQLDLVMVSHLDSDHIVGVKKLFRQLRKEVDDQIPQSHRRLKVKRLWHNIFNDIVGDSTDAYYQKLPASLLAISSGAPSPQLETKIKTAIQTRYGIPEAKAEQEAAWVAAILAAHGDGRELRTDYDFLYQQRAIDMALNAPFKDAHGKPRLIQADASQSSVTVDGLKLEILGPKKAEIEALQIEFDRWLKTRDSTEASILSAYADRSAKNLSSIVCLASLGGKTILFTGDARGDKILETLEEAGHLAQGTLKIDVLKVPHHGSDNNVEPTFFKKVIADHYVFSGDGKHGNPERATLDWLTAARGNHAQYTIHLTYPVSSIDLERKKDMEKRGRTWAADTHSLESFFKMRQDEKYAFTLKDSERVVIELGDESIAW